MGKTELKVVSSTHFKVHFEVFNIMNIFLKGRWKKGQVSVFKKEHFGNIQRKIWMRVWAPAGVHSSSRWEHHKENRTKKIQTPPAPTHSWGALGQVWFCRRRMLSRTAVGQEAFLWESSVIYWDGLRRHRMEEGDTSLHPRKGSGSQALPKRGFWKSGPLTSLQRTSTSGRGKG